MKKFLLILLSLSAMACRVGAQSVTTVPLSGSVAEPYGIAIDVPNNLYYFTDSANNRVLKFDPARSATSIVVDAGPLMNPSGIVFANNGFLVVADTGNQVLRSVDPSIGTVTTLAGTVGTSGNANGTGAAALFYNPAGLAQDASGNIFVADAFNDSVRSVDATASHNVATLANSFFKPAGVAVGDSSTSFVNGVSQSNQQIWVADTLNDQIQLVTIVRTNGQATNNYTAVVIAGQFRVTGHADSSVALNATFNRPRGLLWLGGQTGLLIADTDNNVIRRLSSPNGVNYNVTTFAGTNAPGSLVDAPSGPLTAAHFYGPVGMALDADGAIIVADLNNNALRKISRVALPTPTLLLTGTSLTGGSFSNAINVTFTNSLSPTATYHYTTDGTTPSQFSPSATSVGLDGGESLQFRAYSPDFAASPVGSNTTFSFFVAPPVITPAGITNSDRVTASFSTATLGATFRWTADGSDPALTNGFFNDGSTFITVSNNSLIKVKGFKFGYADSVTTSNLFTLFTATPVVSATAFTSSNTVTVSITDATPGAAIYWTIDGTTPTPASTLYTNPFVLGVNGTLLAKAFRNGFLESQVSTNVFNLFVADPVITPPGATSNNNVQFTITDATTNAAVYYTTDGSEPASNNGILATANLSGSIVVSNNGVLKVKGFLNGFVASHTISVNVNLTVATPVISPGGITTNNLASFTITDATLGASIYWTVDGTLPTTNSFLYTGPVSLSANGTLQARAFRPGFLDSGTASQVFNLSVSDPVLSPNGLTNSNPILVTITSATADATLFYTLNGTEPTASSFSLPLSNGSATLLIATNSLLKVKAGKLGFNGYLFSGTVSGSFALVVGAPTFTPGAGTNINVVSGVTIATATTNPAVHLFYTTDGSAPTTNSAVYTGPLSFFTNTILSAFGFLNGYIASPIVVSNYFIQVDTPSINFSNAGTAVGFSVVRADATIYFTTNGIDPTPSDFRFTTRVPINPVNYIIKARAFAPNTLPSAVAVVQSAPTNLPAGFSTLGVPRDMLAGIGSSIVIPVEANIASNQTLRSVQFRVEVAPISTAVSNLPNALVALNFGPNDFAPLSGNPDGSAFTFSASPYTNGITTNGLLYTSLGTSNNMRLQNSGALMNFLVTLPGTAHVGDTYRISVLQVSGTSDGETATIPMTNLPNRTILVTNVAYLVGDTASSSNPFRWYNAGDFGDGILDNADVNSVFLASFGVHVPDSRTDAFNAMDAYPLDRTNAPGGDGQIRFQDWNTILNRSVGRDTTNYWVRAHSANGPDNYTNWLIGATDLPFIPNSLKVKPTPKLLSLPPGQVWLRQAYISAATVTNANNPGNTYNVPVYAYVRPGSSLAGLQFRASLKGDNGQPPLPQPLSFVPALGSPTVQNSSNDLLCAWSLNGGFTPPLVQGSNYLGDLVCRLPFTGAPAPGQSFTLHFSYCDGAPDANTQYDFESYPSKFWVWSIPQVVPSVISDEWKLSFFGSLDSAQAADNADPDGDGVPNWQEYLAGTNPTNSVSNLHLTSSLGSNHSVNLSWLSAPTKGYVLESRTGLSGTWNAVTNVAGDGYSQKVLISNTTGTRFYRLRLQ
jgi:Chitobiase/beta-hexosaminidase C-terminal domain/Fn3 associated